ncbi:hypothetical protein TNCV_2015841 [Trichonephila clavipes]|nr:hypothetical protein TNCV_2015841 [Trichonephila clavipes]
MSSSLAPLKTHRAFSDADATVPMHAKYLEAQMSSRCLDNSEKFAVTAFNAGSSSFAVAVGSLVVRASDSRPEGLGPMPDATKYPPSTYGVRAR